MPGIWIDGVRPKSVIPDRVIVCGTRTFDDKDLLFSTLDKATFLMTDLEVITGGQRKRIGSGKDDWQGADYWAERWAELHWYDRKIFHADWEAHGKAAGPLRNEEMALYAMAVPDHWLLAFWDGVSPGTKDMLTRAEKYHIPTMVIEVDC